MNINLELYRIFSEVVKAGSMTKAAENLFISQSAVSQAMMNLENELGGRLFHRGPRGVRLTAEGNVLFSYVSNAVSLIENAEEKLSVMRSLRSGEIKISTSDTICSLFLLSYLKEFNTDHPHIHFSVSNHTTGKSIDLLKSGAVDLSILNLPVGEDPMLEITPVMEIHDCFVAGTKYSGLRDRELSFEELKEYPILMLDKASNSRNQMDIFFRKKGIDIQPVIELGSLYLLSEFAKIGLGIAATIKEDVQVLLDKGELFELRLRGGIPNRHLGLAHLNNVPLSFAAEAFKKTVLMI